MKTTKCDFCNNTGQHYAPDVAEPILITCSKKGCVYGQIRKVADYPLNYQVNRSKLKRELLKETDIALTMFPYPNDHKED